jgi:4-amino-4-deoxy-L-arabinose transferase-like glycosyltransferase
MATVLRAQGSLDVRRLAGQICGALALFLFALSGLGFRWFEGQTWVWPVEGIVSAGLGAVALGAAVVLVRPRIAALSVEAVAPTRARVRLPLVGLGVGLLVVFAELNGARVFEPQAVSYHVHVALFVAGLAFTAAGLGAFTGVQPRAVFSRSAVPLLLITAFGFVLRAWDLNGGVHFMVDELHQFEAVASLMRDPFRPILQPMNGISMFPHLFAYTELITGAIFGYHDLGGIRAASVVFGTLTIPAVWLLGRALGDRRTGLLAAFALAVLPVHIHFSRLAMINIVDPLFGTLALAFFALGLRCNRERDYVLGGLMLGLTSYFYEGGRLVFLGTFAAWLVGMVVWYRPWQHRRGLALGLLAAVLVALPYYYALPRFSESLSPRLSAQGFSEFAAQLQADPVQALVETLNGTLRYSAFHTIYSYDSSGFYYGGATGAIHWFVVPFYLMGLFYALYKWRGGGVLLFIWVASVVIGLSRVVGSDWTVRFAVAFPAWALLIAAGVRYPLEMLLESLNGRAPGSEAADARAGKPGAKGAASAVLAPAVLAPAVLVGVLGVFQLQYYYGQHLPAYQVQARMDAYDFYDAFVRAQAVPDADVLVYATDVGVFFPVLDTMRFLSDMQGDYQVWRPSEGFTGQLAALPPDGVYVFAIVPDDTATFEAIDRRLPLSPLPPSPFTTLPDGMEYAMFIYRPPAQAAGE